MFASAGLLAQNRKLANAQKLIGNRNRIVQLAELGKKQNPVKCDISIGVLNAEKIRRSLESAQIVYYALNDMEISDDELTKNISEQLGTFGQEVIENINKALGNNYHLESAINSARNFLGATIDLKNKQIDNFMAIQKIEEEAYTVKKERAGQAIQVAGFCKNVARAILEILTLSKNEYIAGGRRTRRNRKNKRNTRRI